jgi:hypothetical protein
LESRRFIQAICLLIVLSSGVAAAQGLRDDWRLGSTYPVNANLVYSLANAPLTTKERQQIYRLLDNETVHDSFTDAQREEERATVMDARIGFIELAEGGGQQVLVQGPSLFCGASGNCRYLVFTRQRERLRLVLDAEGDFVLRKTSSHGFHDVVTSWHMSAYEQLINVYRWDGTEYKRADCYSVNRDRDNADKPPEISGCRKGP